MGTSNFLIQYNHRDITFRPTERFKRHYARKRMQHWDGVLCTVERAILHLSLRFARVLPQETISVTTSASRSPSKRDSYAYSRYVIHRVERKGGKKQAAKSISSVSNDTELSRCTTFGFPSRGSFRIFLLVFSFYVSFAVPPPPRPSHFAHWLFLRLFCFFLLLSKFAGGILAQLRKTLRFRP